MLNHAKMFHFIGCHHHQTGIDEALQVLVLSNSYDCVTTFLYILYYFSDNKFIKIAQKTHMALSVRLPKVSMDPLKKQRLKTPFHIQVELVFVMTSNKVRTKKKERKTWKKFYDLFSLAGLLNLSNGAVARLDPLTVGLWKNSNGEKN